MLDGRLDCFVSQRARNGRVSAPYGCPSPCDRLRRWRTVRGSCVAWGFGWANSVKHELILIEVIGFDLDPNLLAGVHD